MTRRSSFIAFPALLAGLVFAPAHGATVDVVVKDFAFDPASVTIKAGDTIRWVWDGGRHTVTSGGGCRSDGRWNFNVSSPDAAATFTFPTAGTFPYYCDPHCGIGMTGQVVVQGAPQQTARIDNPVPSQIRRGNIAVRLRPVVTGLTAPNAGISAPGLAEKLFVSDQIGVIWSVDLTTRQKGVFADLKSLLVPLGVGGGSYDERGLLGIAFHPGYASNGLLYTFTSEPVAGPADFSTLANGATADHQSVVREWVVGQPGNPASTVDPAATRVVIRIDKPQFNHNGGALAFGPDNQLYIALGDGGSADDQGVGHVAGGNAQSLANVLGKVLRIDPLARTAGRYRIPTDNPFVPADGPAVGGQGGCSDGRCDEIFAYGLRNPFRMTVDLQRGDIYTGDVGQNALEEIDLIRRGANYGWRRKEGRFCFQPNGAANGFITSASSCDGSGLTNPVAQYDHDEGVAVVGGYVYRGTALPALQGRYIFGDYAGTGGVNGRLFYLTRTEIAANNLARSGIAEFKLRGRTQLGLALLGFGQDAAGELYVLGNRTGVPKRRTGGVWRIQP